MKRSELFAMVWAQPISRLAPILGISGCGLSKLCKRHDIPIPGLGYWAKRAAGLDVLKPQLPPRETDEVIPRFSAGGEDGASGGGAVSNSVLATILARFETGQGGEGEKAVPAGLAPAVDAPTGARDGADLAWGAGDQQAVPIATAAAAKAPLAAPARPRGRPTMVPVQPPMSAPAGQDGPAPVIRPQIPDPAESDRAAELALDAEWHRAAAVAAEYVQRRALQELLTAVTVLAAEEAPDVQRVILLWSDAVRQRLDQDDPVSRVVGVLRSLTQAGGEPLWIRAAQQ